MENQMENQMDQTEAAQAATPKAQVKELLSAVGLPVSEGATLTPADQQQANVAATFFKDAFDTEQLGLLKSVASGLVHAYTSVTGVVASVKALVASSAEDLKDTVEAAGDHLESVASELKDAVVEASNELQETAKDFVDDVVEAFDGEDEAAEEGAE